MSRNLRPARRKLAECNQTGTFAEADEQDALDDYHEAQELPRCGTTWPAWVRPDLLPWTNRLPADITEISYLGAPVCAPPPAALVAKHGLYALVPVMWSSKENDEHTFAAAVS